MIESAYLSSTVFEYRQKCRERKRPPTYEGLAHLLNITGVTVRNVTKGKYNGKRYSDIEANSRCIANKDFETVQDLFRHKQ